MRILPNVTLTSNQKRILAKIAAAPTPKVAGEEISGDQNLIGARDQLAHLGAIEFVAGEATMTDKGQQLAKEENIIDDSGELTPDGETLAYTSSMGKEDKDKTEQPPVTPSPGMPQMGIGGPPSGVGAPPPAAPGGMGDNLFMSDVPMSFKQFLKEANERKCPRCGVEPFQHWNLGYNHKCHVCGTAWKSSTSFV